MKVTSAMIGIKYVVFLVVLTFLWIPSSGDPEVFCVFMERCILPCSFQVAPQVVIHWTHMTKGDLLVHSFYDNQDHLGRQDQMFRNRTSLFQDQISRGNASLQLTGVKVQDEGRYKCYCSTTSGNKESFINLKVDAPIQTVDIQQVENRITCSSEGIYPEPELTWSTTPPSNINLHNTTHIIKNQNQQQLYSISSSLILSDNSTDLVYSCTVTNHRNSWTTTSRHQTTNSSETTIPCTTSNSGLSSFSLVWRFNHSQMILNQTSADLPCTITPEWKQYVKDVSESGDIKLQDLSSDQEGIYTCQLSNATETSVTNTILRIENYRGDPSTEPGGSVAGIAVGVVLSIVVLAALVLVVFYIRRRRQNQENERPNRREDNNPGEGDGVEMEPLANGEGEAAQVPAAPEN